MSSTVDVPTIEEFTQVFAEQYLEIKRIDRSILPSDRLDNLGLDSLAMLEMIVALEAHYSTLLLNDSGVSNAVSVADLYHVLSTSIVQL